jgi:hypothetical protein
MHQHSTLFLLLLAKISAVFAFAPTFSVHSGAVYDAMLSSTSGLANIGIDTASKSLLSGADSLLLSAAEVSEDVARQGVINWENPGEAFVGSIFLLYVVFSILAGIKYVVKDGWRPDL